MPSHDSLGPDDGYGAKDARAATIELDEQSAVSPTQMQSAWCALLEDIELMPQNQDFCFQPPSRLEAVAQHTDEEEANCDHQSQSCSIRLPPSRRRMEFSEATGRFHEAIHKLYPHGLAIRCKRASVRAAHVRTARYSRWNSAGEA